MTFVFLAFAVSPVANTRQFGIGLTVAVVLDATVVRLILLPALIRLFGERTWAVPPWLDRVLPRFSTHWKALKRHVCEPEEAQRKSGQGIVTFFSWSGSVLVPVERLEA